MKHFIIISLLFMSFQASAQCPSRGGLTIFGVIELNALGDNRVAFAANTQLTSGWGITSSTFDVVYRSGRSARFFGRLNPIGFPQILVPVPCDDPVVGVTATITARSGSRTCTRSYSQRFLSVCGTGGGIGLN